MESKDQTSLARIVEYDSLRRRLWILGQRCHHGATGVLVATAACMALIVEKQHDTPWLAMFAAGGALMAHDWQDHSMWFELGRGNQP